MIRSLIWKEWREQRWKIFYISMLMVSANVIGLKTRLMPDELIMMISVFIGAFFLPIFIGMGLFATEREERSLPVLVALPIRGRVIFTVKMGMGVLACLIPFGVSLASALVMAGTREVMWQRVLLWYAGGLGFGLTLLIWIVAFGLYQPTEARTGLVGLAVIAGWLILLCLEEGSQHLFLVAYKISPFYWFEMLDRHNQPFNFRAAIIQGILAGLLLAWSASRFSKVERKSS
jgi:ABC-type transport system involved in multi-copper enzyme maturation permease subunit